MANLAVYITDHPVPYVETADGNALLYHIICPQNGTGFIIAESMGSRLHRGTTTITHHLHCHPTKVFCVRIVTLMFFPRVMSGPNAWVLILPLHMSINSQQHSRHEDRY